MMNVKAIIFDEEAVNIFSFASINHSWFDSFSLPENKEVRRVEIDGYVYFVSSKASENSRLLVIKLGDEGVFSSLGDKDKANAFDRLLTLSLSKLGRKIVPKKNWGIYREENITSFYATLKHSNDKKRLYIDVKPCETKNIYAFLLRDDGNKISYHDYDEDTFIEAVTLYDEALSSEDVTQTVGRAERDNYGIELTQIPKFGFSGSFSLEQWYESELTDEQRTFVDKGYDEPVRLKGAAGTGKTQALAVKFLKDAYDFEKKNEPKRLLFLTHSHSTSEMVLNTIHTMDSEEKWGNFEHVSLTICSLYDLAQELLNYNLSNLNPLSTDGKEGRELQFEIVNDLIQEKKKDIHFVKSKLEQASPLFSEKFSDEEKRSYFILEILNEFACILDAENITLGTQESERYLTGAREPWQMLLDSQVDREIVLELHNEYKDKLKEYNALSMDQMIADLSGYLRSHAWSHLCLEKGYDAIFVDELHYFTKPERILLHEFYRGDGRTRIPMFMAYDMKQSNNDNFLYQIKNESAANLVKSTNVGATELVELTKVFRYTPEIADFLNDLDGSFPALDLVSEWNSLNLKTEDKSSGQKPSVTIYDTNINLIDKVFFKASQIAKRDKKKTVAVLCLNRELFSAYLKAGRIKKFHEPLISRDQSFYPSKLNGRCIFSMPEYVAGHQFNTVFLIHIDRNELDEENMSSGAYRRFVSQVYLGASRARDSLFLASSTQRRGLSQIVECAVKNDSLDVINDLYRNGVLKPQS